ncbi:MAG: hypothetical protein ACYDCQ_00635 [Dehalococcoidia bacterium]
MPAETAQLVYDDLTRDPDEVIARLRADLLGGATWLPALLAAVKRWRVPHEQLDGRHYYYLIGGEAFDWLLLAERLLDAVADLVPADEREALIFDGVAPTGLDAGALKQAFGPVKYRAHLNFLYGVMVEEGLQLSVEEDVHKELRCRAWGFDLRTDESVFQRIYLKSHDALLTEFREQRSLPNTDTISFSERKEFTYWLFKYRVRQCDRAKVAADTRRGLTKLAQLDALRKREVATVPAEMPGEVIDIYTA